MDHEPTRRRFLQVAAGAALASLGPLTRDAAGTPQRRFEISLAAWSLHREIRSGKIKVIDAIALVREEFDLDAFELVNHLLEVPTAAYVDRLAALCERYRVEIPLIMVDAEGSLGHRDPESRKKAVRDHAKWLYIASDLGCHSIRVNWGGADRGTKSDPARARQLVERSVPAFTELCDLGRTHALDILIENHWGPSSDPDLLLGLIEAVDHPGLGTLPDFGNFPPEIDRYVAVDRMMPYAKAVSAKCYDFDATGRETQIDFERMLQICVDKHGYHGYIGIEYEGQRLSEREGILAAKRLLERLRGV